MNDKFYQNRLFEEQRLRLRHTHAHIVGRAYNAALIMLNNVGSTYKEKQKECSNLLLPVSINFQSSDNEKAWYEGVMLAKTRYSNLSVDGRKNRKRRNKLLRQRLEYLVNLSLYLQGV